MDFALSDNLDLVIEDGEYSLEQDGETTMIAAFFSDARIDSKRGYWLPILSSEIWKHDQARISADAASELEETARQIAAEIVSDGVYRKIEVSASIDGIKMALDVKCYSDKGEIVERKFSI